MRLLNSISKWQLRKRLQLCQKRTEIETRLEWRSNHTFSHRVCLPLDAISNHVRCGSRGPLCFGQSVAVYVTLCNVLSSWPLQPCFVRQMSFPVNFAVDQNVLFFVFVLFIWIRSSYSETCTGAVSSHCDLAVLTILSSACCSLPNMVLYLFPQYPTSSNLCVLLSHLCCFLLPILQSLFDAGPL